MKLWLPLVRIAIALAAALLGGARAAAQELWEGPVPEEYDDGPIDRWVTEEERASSPFHRRRFEDRWAEDLQAGAIAKVARAMVDEFRALQWGANEPEKDKIVRQLELFLDDFEFALRAPGIDGPLDTRAEQDAFLRALNATGRGVETLRVGLIDVPGSDEPVAGYFRNRSEDPDDWLLLYRYDEAASDTRDADVYRLTLTRLQVRQWRMLENALSDLVANQVGKVLRANVEFLELQVERWENYLDRGYSQMPWESLVNGWLLDLPEHGPPDRQWIVMHPTLGLELGVDPLDEARAKESLHVEVLGHLWYRGEKLEDYWGLSASVSLREDLDPGIGVLFHVKRNWNVGITWHDVDEDPFVFLSFDLFRFARANAPRYVEQYEALRAQLGLR